MSHLMRWWHFSSSVNSFLNTLHSHPVGLDVRFLARPFVYFRTSYVRTAKALVRLHRCAGSPESSLVSYVIGTIISGAGSNKKKDSCNRYFCVFSAYQNNDINEFEKILKVNRRNIMEDPFIREHIEGGWQYSLLLTIEPPLMTKPTKWPVCPAKTQISLSIRPVWSELVVCLKKVWVLSYQ